MKYAAMQDWTHVSKTVSHKRFSFAVHNKNYGKLFITVTMFADLYTGKGASIYLF